MAILIVVGAGVNAQEVANSALGKVVSNANVANTAKQSVNNKTTDNQTLWISRFLRQKVFMQLFLLIFIWRKMAFFVQTILN